LHRYTTVSRNAAHEGIVGYLCEQDATAFTLACPADQTIAEVMFANYGGTAGSCTAGADTRPLFSST